MTRRSEESIDTPIRQTLVPLVAALFLASLCQVSTAQEDLDRRVATGPSLVDRSIRVLPGFRATILHELSPTEGSWVSLAIDSQGRLLASDQWRGLFRITLPSKDEGISVERLPVELGGAQGLVYAFESLYTVVSHREESGLYRLRDTTGDDHFDDVKLLRRIRGSGEHGPHAVVLGPDGHHLYILGGNESTLPNPEVSRVPHNWALDPPLAFAREENSRNRMDQAGGWICRTDLQGESFELIATGLRNPYDLAFNAEGELFTFDADAERDMGLPLYRPTRVNHVSSGADFGWRPDKWPDYYLDSLGSVVDIGIGSPTGVLFGYGAAFPKKFQQALFLCDWSYGKIYALHLAPSGSSYTGQVELFLAGAPLPVVDAVVHPEDGALYFVTGGRDTTSLLYRIDYVGEEPTNTATNWDPRSAKSRETRRDLERYHVFNEEDSLETVWPYLSDTDRRLRYTARVALEHQPLERWGDRAFTESNTRARIAAMVAVARTGGPEFQPRIVEALSELDVQSMDEAGQLDWLRAVSLTFTRHGRPEDNLRSVILSSVEGLFPSPSSNVNRELAQLLSYLQAPHAVEELLDQLEGEPTQEDQILYARTLSRLDGRHWNIAQHQRFFEWYNGLALRGRLALIHPRLGALRDMIVSNLSADRTQALGEFLEVPSYSQPDSGATSRDFLENWAVNDFIPLENGNLGERDRARGQHVFSEAGCYNCHRVENRGGFSGPNLTGLGARFDTRTLLESLLEPSKVISDEFDTVNVMTVDGLIYQGRIKEIEEETVKIVPYQFDPSIAENQRLLQEGRTRLFTIPLDEIDEIRPSNISAMPDGLLDYFDKGEVLDLLSFLESLGTTFAGKGEG